MATSSQIYFEIPPILQLSQELIDEIIDDTPELEDLKSLSLVCQVFRPRCERHIFTSIRFHSDDAVGRGKRAKRIQQFIDILSRKPYVAGYVQELYLGVEGRDQEWIVKPDFLKIMDLIRQSGLPLKKFELAGHKFDWPKIANPRRFAESFCAPFISPFLSSLCIKDLYGVPLTLVTGCTNLRSLEMTRVTFGGLNLVRNTNTSLRALRFDRCSYAIQAQLLKKEVLGSHPFLDFSKLRIIQTDASCLENVMSLGRLLQVPSVGSLEELYLRMTCEYLVYTCELSKILPSSDAEVSCDDLSKWIDCGTLCQLRILHVDIPFTYPGLSPDGLISICKLLKTISFTNVLEELTIGIFLGLFWKSPDQVEIANWAFLDHEVRRLSSGKPLQFHLHLLYNTADGNRGHPESEDVYTDEHQNSNSSHYPHALVEQTFRKMVEKKLPMIRSDLNIIFHLTIDPDCPPQFPDT